MKKSAGKMFVIGFLKSFLIIGIFIGIGAFSYQMVMHYLKAPNIEAIETVGKQEPKYITKTSIDDISKNLIYCFDDKTGEINKILLEIFHCKNKKLYYITIPVRTQFTMTDSLYCKLIPVNPAIPQMIKLSGISKYFDKDTVYDYGVLIMEDLLKINISYYTAIPQSIYETMFVTENLMPDVTNKEEAQSTSTVPKELFSEEYITFLKSFTTAEALSKYIEDIYSSIQSNLTLNEKMNYFESYCNTPSSSIFFELIHGVNHNSAYIVDTDLATQQFADYMSQPTVESN